MDAGLIAFIAGMIGLLVGVLSMNAVARSEREQERSLVSAPALRDGAAQVLAVIGRAYLVIDEVGGVVQASPGAYAMGLVRGHTVASDELGGYDSHGASSRYFVERSLRLTAVRARRWSWMCVLRRWAMSTFWCWLMTVLRFLVFSVCVMTLWRMCRMS